MYKNTGIYYKEHYGHYYLFKSTSTIIKNYLLCQKFQKQPQMHAQE